MKHSQKLLMIIAVFTALALFAGCMGAAAVGLEEAKAIAYRHAGISEAEAVDRSWETGDGRYEIDFDHGGYEYEYHISSDGQILHWERKNID